MVASYVGTKHKTCYLVNTVMVNAMAGWDNPTGTLSYHTLDRFIAAAGDHWSMVASVLREQVEQPEQEDYWFDPPPDGLSAATLKTWLPDLLVMSAALQHTSEREDQWVSVSYGTQLS
jgi:hypothetical protein